MPALANRPQFDFAASGCPTCWIKRRRQTGGGSELCYHGWARPRRVIFFLDVRSVPRDGPLGAWLEEELAGGVVMIGKENMDSGTVRRMYDGLVFVEESHANTAAHPVK